MQPNIMNWFIGVVEDLNDPEGQERVRVRFYGYHTDQKDYLPTSKLRWARVLDPTTSASVSGVGESNGLVKGSWVMGMFLDGNDMQQPAIMFSLKGKPSQSADTKRGFNDPSGEFPRYIGESDVNRLARNKNTDQTIVKEKRDGRIKGIEGTANSESWDEPEVPYDAVYPYNKVKESVSGHVEEIDDTPGAERINRHHKEGTFEEIHPDGSKVVKVVKDNYELVLGDDKVYVKGNVQVYIGGNADIKVAGKTTLESPEIDMGIEDLQPMVKGDNLADWIVSSLIPWLNTHTHIGNLGYPTTVPVTSFTPGDAAKSGIVYSSKNRTQ